ncbi:MAG: type II methionyl aminopeptidase, partial [Nitrososphaerales archaeon]
MNLILDLCSWCSNLSNPIPQEYYKAGSIASEVREHIRKTLTGGVRILDICEEVESMILDLGGKPAFPCNVCINEVAAHYTAEPEEKGLLHESDLVKVDIGVHVDGYVADTATTVSLDPHYADLLEATEVTLNEALSIAREGVRLGEIGRTVTECSKRRGFRPITNLSGHSLDRYRVHAGKSIPNTWTPGPAQLAHGEVYAIEPFLTLPDGAGMVKEGNTTNIFSMISRKRTG